MKKVYLIVLLFSFSSLIFCQEEDVSNYFDDGGLSLVRNVISINMVSPVVGDIAVYYERVFDKTYAIEVGVGYIPYYGYEFPQSFFDDRSLFGLLSTKGYSYRIYPKYYMQKMGPEFNCMGILHRGRVYIGDEGSKTKYNDYAAMLGLHFFIKPHFIFEYDIGMGYRRIVEKKNGEVDDKEGKFIMPLHLKFGVKF